MSACKDYLFNAGGLRSEHAVAITDHAPLFEVVTDPRILLVFGSLTRFRLEVECVLPP